MTRRRVAPAPVVTAVLLASIALAGCGSSSKPSAAQATSGSGASAAATVSSSGTVPIGVIGSFTGVQASSQSTGGKVAQAWADATNAAGGLGGKQIKLYVLDDGGDASKAVSDVKQLVETDHVVALLDNDIPDQSWATYIAGTGVPVVGGTSLNLPFLTNPDFYPSGTNAIALAYGGLASAKSTGGSVGSLYCAESPECASGVPLQKAIAGAIGLTIGVSSKISATAPDYTGVCQQLIDAKVTASIIADGPAIAKRVADSCLTAGLKATQIVSGVTLDTSLLTDPAYDGALATDIDAPFFSTDTPAHQAFHAAVAKYAPSISAAQVNANSQLVWIAGKLLEAAVNAGPKVDITSASIKTGLYALKGETLGGLAPPLTFTQGQPTAINCYFTYEIKGGKLVATQGDKTTCAPDALISGVVAALPKS